MGGNRLEKRKSMFIIKICLDINNNSPIYLIFKNYIVFTSSHPLFRKIKYTNLIFREHFSAKTRKETKLP